jgi:F-type H+-transporting ATPase subunit b
MLIDWFTVAAQAVNFLVLVWLLRRFLYGPITRAMTERQRGIDEQLAAAERLHADAAAEGERLREETTRFAAERDERSRRMREELDDTRREQLALVRADVDELRTRWRGAVVREREGFLLELRQRTGERIVDIARRALRDLADESLEAQVIGRFLARLREVDEEQRNLLVSSAEADGGLLHLRTAFEVPGELRTQLLAAVDATVGPGLDLRFEVVPTLLCGVELRAGGHALAWTFDEYVETLDAALAEALGKEWEPDAAT